MLLQRLLLKLCPWRRSGASGIKRIAPETVDRRLRYHASTKVIALFIVNDTRLSQYATESRTEQRSRRTCTDKYVHVTPCNEHAMRCVGTLSLALPLGPHPLRVQPDRWPTHLEQHAQKFKRKNSQKEWRSNAYLLRDTPT